MYDKATILMLGDSRTTLTFVRSLAAAGHRIVTGRSEATSYGQYSRFTSEVWQHPPAEGDGGTFMRALQEFLLQRPDITLIFPLGDRQLKHLAMFSHMVPRTVKVVMAKPSVTLSCLDKAAAYDTAAKLGIPHAQHASASSLAELAQLADELGYPCIVKPDDPLSRVFGQKAIICRTEEELQRRFVSWPEGSQELLVQRFAQGFRHNIQLLASNGELVCSFQTRTLRTDRSNGTGYTVESVSVERHPLMHEHCVKLLRQLQFSGLGCAQFLLNESDGGLVFLELNPRLGAAFAVAGRCGIDFPTMAAGQFLHRPLASPAPDIDYPAGRRIVWTHGDIQGLLDEYRAGVITRKQAARWLMRIVLSFLRADVHASWSWRDPMPTVMVYARLVRRMTGKLLRLPVALAASTIGAIRK